MTGASKCFARNHHIIETLSDRCGIKRAQLSFFWYFATLNSKGHERCWPVRPALKKMANLLRTASSSLTPPEKITALAGQWVTDVHCPLLSYISWTQNCTRKTSAHLPLTLRSHSSFHTEAPCPNVKPVRNLAQQLARLFAGALWNRAVDNTPSKIGEGHSGLPCALLTFLKSLLM